MRNRRERPQRTVNGEYGIVRVVVVGAGGAGLAAASEAARLGRSVVLLEKNPQPGGSTSWSVGSITATNTPHQQRAGIQDSPQEHFEDLGRFAGELAPRDNLALRRILVEHTNEIVGWLMSHGVVFVGPVPEPPHRHDRMHNVVPNSRSFAHHLVRHCRSLGVDIRVSTGVSRLVTEAQRVIGVEARDAGGTVREFRARGGVVLASGVTAATVSEAESRRRNWPEVDAVNLHTPRRPSRRGNSARVIERRHISGTIMPASAPRPNRCASSPVASWPPVAWVTTCRPALRPFLMSFAPPRGASPALQAGAIWEPAAGNVTDELQTHLDTAKNPKHGVVVFDTTSRRSFRPGQYVATAGAWPTLSRRLPA